MSAAAGQGRWRALIAALIEVALDEPTYAQVVAAVNDEAKVDDYVVTSSGGRVPIISVVRSEGPSMSYGDLHIPKEIKRALSMKEGGCRCHCQ